MPQEVGERNSQWSYLLIAGLLLPSFFWIIQDYRVWPWDQAWYGEVSVDLWYWLTHSPYRWLATMADGLDLKPPAVVWIGQFFVPLNRILGSSERSLLFFILLTQFVLLVIVYKSGQAISPNSRLVPMTGALFAASGQLFAGLSHQFFVEPLQAVAVAWTLLIALKAPKWTKSRIAVHLIGALTLGLLAKATTPVYVLFPCLYCLFLLVRRPPDHSFADEWKSRSFQILTVAIGCSVFVGAVWYLRHLADVWRHVHDSTSGDIALDYATPGSSFDRLKIWIHVLKQSFLSPYLVWAIVPALVVAAIWMWRASLSVKSQSIAVISVLQIALLLWVFSINTVVEPRYMYAILPCLAILFMQICAVLPRPAVISLLVLCALQWGVVSRASLGSPNELADQSQWLYPPQRDRSQFDDLTRVVHLTSNVSERYNMLAVEEPWINANSAAFFAAKDRLNTGVRCYFTSIGYAQKDPAAAMRRIEEFRTRYVITLAEPFQTAPPNFLNLATLPVLEQMRRDTRFARQEFASQNGVVIFQFNPVPASTQPTQDATRKQGSLVIARKSG